MKIIKKFNLCRFIPSGIEHFQNYFIYFGKEVLVRKNTTFSSKLACEFNLRWFPFDEQYCTIDLLLTDKQKKLVELEPGRVGYHGSDSIADYLVQSITMCRFQFLGREGIRLV